MKTSSFLQEEASEKVCELCGKKTNDTICVKIEEQGVYHPVRNICKECVEKNRYKEYDGSDWASDWN